VPRIGRAAVVVLIVAGCAGATTPATSSTAERTTTSATTITAPLSTGAAPESPPRPVGPQPTTMRQLCDEQAWPRPVPAAAGLILNDASTGALGCWDNLAAIAPDGHDVENDRANDAQT
jgi:hypothetical protein